MQKIAIKNKEKEKEKDFLCIGILWLAATLFLLTNSFPTSPAFGSAYSGDAAMFLTIGKYWAEGTLPYIGLWDSKGPIIFGINALGYLMTGSKTGVFLIQVLCLAIAMLFVYKLFRKTASALVSLIGSGITLWIMLTDYAGDGTEEFVLPLLCASFYLMHCWSLKATNGKEKRHAPRAAFLYGLTFSFCFLTRLTNAVGVCAGVLVITVFLIANKEFLNLAHNAAAFLLGVATLLLPFVIYFQSKGILYDAFYGTFLYNLDYAGKSNMGLSTMSFGYMWRMFAGYSGAIFLAAVGAVEMLSAKEKRASGVLWLAIGIVTAIWLFHSYGFLHYGLIAVPCFPIAFMEIWNLDTNKRKAAIGLRLAAFGFVLLGVLGSVKTFREQRWEYSVILSGVQDTNQQTDERMLNQIPEEEKDSFVAYNTGSDLYLRADIKPCYRFFAMQDWAASQSESLTEMLVDTFEHGTARWILVRGDPEATLISDALKTRYEPVQTEEDYMLYRLNEE